MEINYALKEAFKTQHSKKHVNPVNFVNHTCKLQYFCHLMVNTNANHMLTCVNRFKNLCYIKRLIKN